jgi:trimeric autotransporter adhesin
VKRPLTCHPFGQSLILAVTCVLSQSVTFADSADDYWDSTFGVPGSDGTIWSMVRHGSDLYVGGSFNKVGGIFATNIAKWDGTNWAALGPGLSGGGFPEIHALVFIGEDLYAGGYFTQAGEVLSRGIAKWNGTNWLGLSGGVSGGVRALSVSEGKLVAGGNFSMAGGVAANNIAAWNGTNWSNIALGLPGEAVDSLAVAGSTMYAGGRFRVGNGVNATNIARWNGAGWTGLGEGIRVSNQSVSGGMVRTLLVTENGLLAAGSFRLAGSVNATNIARWDGTNWWPLGAGIDPVGSVYALALNGSDVYAGGYFGSAGGISVNDMARWDGVRWWPLGSGIGAHAAAFALSASGSELFVGGGDITTAGGKPATNLATWHIPHALSVSYAEETMTISWPATGTNLVLEGKGSVADTNWSMVSNPPVVVDGQCRVTQPMDSPARFFRLRRK